MKSSSQKVRLPRLVLSAACVSLFCGSAVLTSCTMAANEESSESTATEAASAEADPFLTNVGSELQPLGAVQDTGQGQGSLEQQKNRFLFDDAMNKAQELLDKGQLEDAKTAVLRALEYDKDNSKALELLQEVRARLGERGGAVEEYSERMNRLYEIGIEKQKSEARKLIGDANKAMEGGRYDDAIRDLRRVMLNVEIGNKLDWEEIPEQAKALLDRAESERKAATQMRNAEVERETFEKNRLEEERLAAARKARIDFLLARGTKAYENRDFGEAQRLAREALRVDATHDLAQDLADAADKAIRDKVDDDYVRNKARAYKRFFEKQKELKIPYTDVLTLDAQKWAEINAKRQQTSAAELVEATKDAATRALESSLRTTRLPKGLKFDDTNGGYLEVIDTLGTLQQDVPILVAPEAKEAIASNSYIFTIELNTTITLEQFLNLMVDRTDGTLAYIVTDGAVLLTTKERALGKPRLHVFSTGDLTFPVTNFAGPLLRDLPGPPGSGDSEVPPSGGEVGEKIRFLEPEALANLVKQAVAPGTWDSGTTSLEATGNKLLVRHTPQTIAKVEQFLNDLRRFQTTLVAIESRFLRVERNWLKQIGVDIRGLGGANAKGTVAQLDDITNGLINNASRGLDNGGTGDPSAHPASGFFYDDGLDGDFRGRNENYFQNPIGRVLEANGGLSFGFTLLDDAQLNLLLNAVEKQQSLQLVDSQNLTVLNGQRSNISVINQTAFIQDFSVEVATASFIADPEVNVIQDGIVLDVRPTVSSDQKYVTLDLQPTVAELVRPIPTFTTSLSGSTLPVTIQFPQMTVRSTATTVTVPDGGSVLIGGLNQILNRERRAQVPWLANLPLISFFFKQEGQVDENSSLMVLVKADIVNVTDRANALLENGTR
ncbi:MAG: hypothetical protein H6832_07000 [Planctomycetes bacterium]|nr:hypothetical protein [Planctomycetota bacterium]MCB9918135.1 hypothetical protein [Planctomycetota bacterium]